MYAFTLQNIVNTNAERIEMEILMEINHKNAG